MNDTSYMREKKILPLLLSMAIPMVLSMIINSLYNIVDGIFVARLGEDAMMAISLVYPIQNLMHAISVGFGIGTNVVIALYLGCGKHTQASAAASQGILLNFLHGLCFTLFGILFLQYFLEFFTDNTDVINYGVRYGTIVLCFCVVQTVSITYEKIFQSVGRVLVSMISLGGSCLINIILDPLMIFGIGPFPAMGIDGAAYATVIGQTCGLLFYMSVCYISPLNLKLSFSAAKPTPEITKKIYAIGIPATLNIALPSVLVSVLNSLLGRFSETQVLILGIYYKLQNFLYLSANGVIQGMRPIMSYNFCGNETDRVRKIYRTSLTIIGLILFVGTILGLTIPNKFIGLFTENTVTIALGSHALRIVTLGFIASAVSVTTAGALESMGKGIASLFISLLRYVCPILPRAYILSFFIA